MSVSELIKTVGDDHIRAQWLSDVMTDIKMHQKSGSKITFITDQLRVEEVITNEQRMVALVVWMPKDRMPPI